MKFQHGTDVPYHCSNMHCFSCVNQDTSPRWKALKLVFFGNDATIATGYNGGQQLGSIFSLRFSGYLRNPRKINLFAPLFVQYVFVNFSTDTKPIDTKINRHCQWAPTMLVKRSKRSTDASLRFRSCTDTTSEKNGVFWHFFHKLARRVTPRNVTAAK